MRGIGQDGPGDGDPLLLPTRKAQAPLADQGVVSLRQFLDKLVRLRHLGRGDDLFHSRVPPGKADILPDRCRKEESLLKDDRDWLRRQSSLILRTSTPSMENSPK